ncbi:MAG: hypothetical protein U0228_19330 [Myxococcaceae bacterium]
MLTVHKRQVAAFRASMLLKTRLVNLDALGPPSIEDDPHDWTEGSPPGPLRGWYLRAPCGLEFGVAQYWESPTGAFDHAELWAETDDELAHAIVHLPFEVQLLQVLPAAACGCGFAVERLDDAGNSFVVGEYRREASARCIAGHHERRGHKQTYLVRALKPCPPPATPWAVMRIDDHGNVFEVERFTHQFLASIRSDELSETPRHKQGFWVERVGPSP